MRDRNVSVLEAPQPDYDPYGIRIGSFTASPSVTTTASATSNVFENNANRHGDAYLAVLPYLLVGSEWERHKLSVTAGGEFRRYVSNPIANRNTWYVNANGKIEASDSFSLLIDAQVGRFYEAPYASDTTSNIEFLINYLQTKARATGVYTAGRVRMTAAVSYLTLGYANLRLPGQAPQPQTFRNEHDTAGALHAEYALSPSVSAFVEAQFDGSSFATGLPNGQPNHDGRGQRYLAGANFDVAGIMRGQIGMGYTRRSYKAGAYARISGYSYQAQVDVFPNELTTLTVSAGKLLQDDVTAGGNPYFDTRVGAEVDHSFRENLVASATFQFVRQTIVGNTSQRQLYALGTNATYRFTRGFSVTASINDNISRPSGPLFGNPFTELYGALSLTLRR